MDNIININDFTGIFAIPINNNVDREELQTVIDKVCMFDLKNILTKNLYEAFEDNPLEDRFVAITDDLKYILKTRVYYYYIANKCGLVGSNYSSNTVKVDTASIQPVRVTIRKAESMYNKGVDVYNDLMDKLYDEENTYPEFDGNEAVAVFSYYWMYKKDSIL